MISRVRSGRLSLEPLLVPDAQPEAARLSFTEGDRGHLEALFKGLLALARETHIKQLESPSVGAPAPLPKIHVSPHLTVEPLATHYRRRADAYRFVRGVLEEAFGPGALASFHRLTPDGPVQVDLDAELTFMTLLFDGAARTALDEIGADGDGETAEDLQARTVFQAWRARAGRDPDLARDVRMMVPVFFDLERKAVKAWVFLGWKDRPLTITYEKVPRIVQLVQVDEGQDHKPDVVFRGQRTRIGYPVVAEVTVKRILDRREFRAHCDRLKPRSAILAALR